MNLDYLKRINICVDLISEAEYFILPRFIFANDIFFFKFRADYILVMKY